jgi:uncharacterized protein (DUF362 family)
MAQTTSPVAVLQSQGYERDLTKTILEGVALCGLAVKDQRVVLKPNLVEFDGATAINTHPRVVASAFEAFRSLGAASVVIAEGPGHRRDTFGLTEEAGYWEEFRALDEQFVDLNRDNVRAVDNFLGDDKFYFPETILTADLIVSLPKMKTHHWAGATLSMKNFFGVVPGAVYGWPKNILHHKGIPNSIAALNRKFRNTFAIVDGIVGMEGNGPIQGTPKEMGVMVFGRDLVAVDATCCRLMGINPELIEYLKMTSDLGALAEAQIEMRGETVAGMRKDFELIAQFAHLRALSV